MSHEIFIYRLFVHDDHNSIDTPCHPRLAANLKIEGSLLLTYGANKAWQPSLT